MNKRAKIELWVVGCILGTTIAIILSQPPINNVPLLFAIGFVVWGLCSLSSYLLKRIGL